MKNIDDSDSDADSNDYFDFREKFNELETPNILADQIQDEIDKIIKRCDPVDWNEDLLSYQVVCALRNILSCYKLPEVDNSFSGNKFDLEAYKLTGKAEQIHGDLAIVVTRKFPHQKPISGVGFYEAKASGVEYYDEYKYPSFCIQQLRRLVSNTPKLTYLLYNKNALNVGYQEWPNSIDYTKRYEEIYKYEKIYKKRVHAHTVDANFLKQCRNIGAATEAIGQTFGYHFVYKILSGRELDYSRPVEQTIRRWLKTTRRTKALVVSISVHEKNDEQYFRQLELPGFQKVELPKLGF